ncbi:hypothetical protein [Salmonirosea aquatica]|uniref:Uncharacterized protein n=1 Tax=Salmonirosea aquatica TaxID=2654236 RepID=A0A7C9FTJ7_9BACT|nr:hypothetical protein [Cytophagaceae bacterium SJW1-29]
MLVLISQHRTEYDNRHLIQSSVRKIKLSPASPRNERLWSLRFYGEEGKVLRSWFYTTDQKRRADLAEVVKNNPHIEVYQG